MDRDSEVEELASIYYGELQRKYEMADCRVFATIAIQKGYKRHPLQSGEKLKPLNYEEIWISFEKFLEPYTSDLIIKPDYARNAVHFQYWVKQLCENYGHSGQVRPSKYDTEELCQQEDTVLDNVPLKSGQAGVGPLDFQEVLNAVHEEFLSEEYYKPRVIVKFICAKFSQPHGKMPSAQEMYEAVQSVYLTGSLKDVCVAIEKLCQKASQ